MYIEVAINKLYEIIKWINDNRIFARAGAYVCTYVRVSVCATCQLLQLRLNGNVNPTLHYSIRFLFLSLVVSLF